MLRRIVLSATLAGLFTAAAAFAPAASAGSTAWGVAIGAPGLAVTVGQGYGGAGYLGVGVGYGGYGYGGYGYSGYGYGGYGRGAHHYGGHGHWRPYYRAYPAPVVYRAPVTYAYVTPAPYGGPYVARPVYAPRRAYVAPPVFPAPVPYGRY